MRRGRVATHCRPRSEPRRKRAPKRAARLTSMVLGYPLAFTPQFAPQLRFYVCLRHRPIARDRRGSLLGRCSVNNPG